MWITTDGATWTAWQSPLLGHPTRGVEPADFGWIDFQDDLGDPEAAENESPALAISPDAETWQVVPIPIPAAFADRGLTWADANSDNDPLSDWGWEAYAHGNTIFVEVRSGVDQAREFWVGRVDTP